MSSRFERTELRRLLRFFALVLCVASLAGPAFAGQAQEASIIGQVTDESGAVLPGVTVTATSPALQVPQVTDVSNERGEYRLTPLPLGTYAVQYELAGFGTVRREEVRLAAGFTARVDVALKVGALTETVTVSGAAPVVDVASAASRTQLTREALDLIPTGRTGLQSAMVQAPGVRTNLDFGQITSNPEFRAFGQSHESWVSMDGLVTTSPKSSSPGSGNWYDYAALEESTVQTVGSSADAPTRGIQMNIILKSGGNDFHGGGFLAQSGQRFQGNNLDDTLRAQGIQSGDEIDARWDRSGELGGRIVRNKLWFYTAGRVRRENSVILDAFMPDGSPAISSQRQVFSTVKISYQLSPANRLIGFYQRLRRVTGGGQVSRFVEWGSQQIGHQRVDTGKIEWQWAKGNKFISLVYGDWELRLDRDPLSTEVGTFDQVTLFQTGQNRQTPHRQGEGRKSSKGTFSWYKPNLFMGNHDFKAGYDYSPGAWSDGAVLDRQPAGKNYRLIFRSGEPFQLEAHSNPVDPHNPVRYFGTYVQDSWTIARRLTLNLGVRYAHDNGFLPAQCRVAAPAPLDIVFPAQCFPKVQFKIWDPVVPRLHAVYDLTGDGKTVLKGGWGRFAHIRYVDEIQSANENAHLLAFFRWHDNGNKAFELGEVDFDRNGPDFLFTQLEVGETDAGAVPNPNEKEPITDELSLSLERQLITNLALRVTGVYSRNRDTYRIQNNLRPYEAYNIPITNPDPGPDGLGGTGDDPGTFVTYFEYPAALAGRAFQQPTLINHRGSDANFKSIEVAASKRMANRWQLMASYSATKSHVPFIPNTAGGRTVLLTTFDPNAEINAADHNWEWLARVTGAYIFPADLQVSTNFEHRSGSPWGRQVSFTGGRQIPSQSVRVEPIGSRRLPNLNIVHLRVEKSFQLPRAHKIAVRMNVYNAMNVNTVLSVTELSGRSFLRPRTIVPPRIAEVALQYTF